MIPWTLFAAALLAAVLSLSCSLLAGMVRASDFRRWERFGWRLLIVSLSFGILFFGITLREVLEVRL